LTGKNYVVSFFYLITTNPQLALKSAVEPVKFLLPPEQAVLSFFPAQIVG
jgi:hypothetical protein